MSDINPGCELLVISPHTDDAEIGMGGTISTLALQGRRVWAVDLTRGELGSNATPDQRWQEAAEASLAIGLMGRVQLELPDGFVNALDRQHLAAVVWALRTLRPRWVISAPDPVRHPDHVATAELVRRACFMSRLVQLEAPEPKHHLWNGGRRLPGTVDRWTPEASFSVCPDDGKPALIFDISDSWAVKKEALACYASQFVRADDRRETMINDGSFMEKIERRAQTWGRRAGCRYAEAFTTDAVPVFRDFPESEWRS